MTKPQKIIETVSLSTAHDSHQTNLPSAIALNAEHHATFDGRISRGDETVTSFIHNGKPPTVMTTSSHQ